MYRLVTVILALSASAFATVFTTSPVASTTWQAGVSQTVAWQESTDGAKPTLEEFGPARISIYVGNAQQQTPLQTIGSSVDVSKNGSISFVPDPRIGPNGDFYFIRYESISLKDARAPQFPALAFSARFTLSGMTGTFSPAVSSQIAGASTAPVGGPQTTAATTPTTTSARTSLAATTTSRSTSSTARPTGAAESAMRFSGLAVAGAAAVIGVALF